MWDWLKDLFSPRDEKIPHNWGRWEEIEDKSIQTLFGPATYSYQARTCRDCGFRQRALLDVTAPEPECILIPETEERAAVVEELDNAN